jgi:dTDP-glucose 4,6-dehydratase
MRSDLWLDSYEVARMQTLLVTGGAGFIGSCFVRQVIAAARDRVVNLDKLTYAGNLASLDPVMANPRHVFVEGDIADRELVANLLAEYEPSAVVNFAAESHVDRSIDGPAEFVRTNVVGTCTLLEAVRHWWRELPAADCRAFRFLHVSTDEVFGSLGPTGYFDEHSPYSPNSPYSASKAAADHFVRAYHHTYGLPVLTTNCSNNYGPYQFPEKLIPLIILNAIEGRPLPVYGDGRQVRDWLFVEDHCRAIATVLAQGRPGEVYCIGGNAERTNLEVVRSICAIVDRRSPHLAHRPCESLIRHVADRPGHDRRYAIHPGKIRRQLGWSPRLSFETGLDLTVAWYLEHADWVLHTSSGAYRRQRLGLAREAA